jgi:hypothetical protein
MPNLLTKFLQGENKMKTKNYRVTISHLPINTVQHIANEMHLAADKPDYELFDETFGLYPALATVEVLYNLTEDQKKKVVKYFDANFLMGEVIEDSLGK